MTAEPAAPQDFAEVMNSLPDGWKAAMGVTFIRATASEVVAQLTVGSMHLQPLGMVHGGVHAGLVETVASVGAALSVLPNGKVTVGLENHTSFLHAVRGGILRAIGRPLATGRTTCVWEVDVHDDRDRVVATGTVRLLVIDPPGGAMPTLPPRA